MPGRFFTHYSKSLVSAFSGWYRRSVSQDLRKHGLYLDDVIAETPEIKAALKMMPKEEVNLRSMRLLRANDLTIKHAELPPAMQNYDPLHSYLGPYLRQILTIKNEIQYYDDRKRRQYSRVWHLYESACSFVFRKKTPPRYVDRFLCTKYPYFDEWDKPWYKLPSAPAASSGQPMKHSDLARVLQDAEKAAKQSLAEQGYKPKLSEEQRQHLL